ncbi:hypothetical protein EJ02DRAFT_450656 [Clathrospora elynae]|uniref:Uncharacterized protein n=1 Tax=Clathrospora elynae TaxID=706981 RepID=A0A6A5T236_9PLEO|nr:hypothetical protein EJ02DRAFT_450656 [Clathrospora elynae]
MFSLPRISLPSFLRAGDGTHLTVDLPSVKIHDIETAAEKRPRTLKHLIKANHANNSILYHDLIFHNHIPHVLGSAYLLGGTAEHLNELYEKEAEELEPWHDAPGEVTMDEWRDFLGKKEYQRAFIDFFEDQLVSKKYDLKDLLEEFLLGGKEPLINGLISGLAHPLIHLGYAYELQSRTVAIEALALGACCYSFLHKYIDDPRYTKPSPHCATEQAIEDGTDLLGILDKVRKDERFDGLYDHRDGDINKVFEESEEALLEYWNAWKIVNPTYQFRAAQHLAVMLLLDKPENSKFDFFIVHVLTSSHAIRILLPLVPPKFHVSLLRQWWLLTLAVFIAQMRPPYKSGWTIDRYECNENDWKYVVHQALDGPHAKDAHFVKALRAMKVAEETWETSDSHSKYWVKAAVKFADEFEGWGGFGTEE